MTPQLSDIEARVVGCLIEKQVATPDQYPLTLHSLVAACTRKATRDLCSPSRNTTCRLRFPR